MSATAVTGKTGPLSLPIGTQTWTIREDLVRDFEGTLRGLAAMGYGSIEMCSPPGYIPDGFGPLMSLSAGELRQKINGAGLVCESCHYHVPEFREKLDETIAFAKDMGYTQMVLAMFKLPKPATMPEWVAAAEEFNRISESIAKAGMQAVFHNHNMEFESIDGEVIFDRLMATFDPALVKSQFQVAVAALGVDPVAVVRKYAGRIVSLHLADCSPEAKKTTAVGQGTVDWKELFAAAAESGVKNYFVEVSPAGVKPSIEYLQSLEWRLDRR